MIKLIPVKSEYLWYFINHNNESVGCFQLQEVTKITVSVHMSLLEEYQNKDIAIKCFKPLLEQLKKDTTYSKLVCTVPVNNKHMLSVLNKTTFKVCGLIPNGIIWDTKLQDLLIFEVTI